MSEEILNYLGNDKNYSCDCNDGSYYLELPYREAYEIKDLITNLQEENKQLEEKLEKAIKKVKDISFKFTSDKFWYCVMLSTTTDGEELLEILGDKENEKEKR